MIYMLVVVYNKNCEDSETIRCIKNYNTDNRKVIVFDNSTSDYGNKQYCQKNKFEYYTLNKNIGLSKAYNYIIKKINKNDNDYVMILDDDTNLTNDYFNEVYDVIKKGYDLILPVVKSNNEIISPANLQFNCRVKCVKKINNLKINNITAINSGMVIKTSIYNSCNYNEKIFLDYVDHEFMRTARELNIIKKIYISKSVINQNFSRDEKQSLKSALFRFKIFLKDYKIYCSKNNNKLFYNLSIFKFVIKNTIKYHSLDFIKIIVFGGE